MSNPFAKKNNKRKTINQKLSNLEGLVFPEAKESTELLRRDLRIGVSLKLLPPIPENVLLLVKSAKTRNEDVIRNLIEQGTNVNGQDEDGSTLLIEGVKLLDIDFVSFILGFPVNPNIADHSGITPVHWTCIIGSDSDVMLRNSIQILGLLLGDPRTTVNVKDNHSRTPLHIACEAAILPLVDCLLSYNANPNLGDLTGRTPLHTAAANGFYDIVFVLLNHGADFHAKDRDGMRPLHLASQGRHVGIVRLLYEKGSNATAKANDGRTAKDLTDDEDIINILKAMKTSITDPLEIDFVESPHVPVLGDCRIGMSMCPGRNKKTWRRDLSTDIEVIKSKKIQYVVSLVKTDELTSMGIGHYFQTLEQNGLNVIAFPIPDKWIPDSMNKLVELVTQMVSLVNQGASVLVHCNGGKGRTGLVVVCTLVALGMDPNEATDKVREARPGMIRNPAQLVYVRAFKSTWFNR